MKLRHLQVTAAIALLCDSVLPSNTTSYATVGKVAKAGEIRQTESDTAAQRSRMEKPIDEVYVPREAKIERNEIKAEAKLQETTAILQNSAAEATKASKAKTAQESTVLVLSQGGNKVTRKSGSATQALLAPAKPRDSAATTAATMDSTAAASEQKKIDVMALSYDVSRFTFPANAKSLIVVEGFTVKGGKDICRETKVSDEPCWNKACVTVFAKDEAGQWQAKTQSTSIYGYGGILVTRHSGDDTTPIGLWKADTPFGRDVSGEGFPSDYTHIQAKAKRQYWSDRINRLKSAARVAEQKGEKLREDWAKGIYAYALNTGFDKDSRRPGTSSVLSLHCTNDGKPSTVGCVAIQPEAIKAVLHQYAKSGMYIAQIPEGQFGQIYSAFGESGAAAKDEFRALTKELPATETVMLQ